MDVAVVYETHYGQTRAIACAIADGARSGGADAVVLPLTEVTPQTVEEADLLLVGAPTHVLGMSRRWTRGRAHPAEVGTHGDIPDGVREWLGALPAAEGVRRAVAFDTRLPSPFAGGASRAIEQGLRGHGFTLVAQAQGFFVEEAEGPLRPGEEERARVWGAELARVAERTG